MKGAARTSGEEGVIMADALVAVVIVSLMVAVCLGTLKITRAFSHTSADAQEASVALAAVLESLPRAAGEYNGVSGRVSYRADVTEETVQDVRLCRIEVAVRPRVEGRVYRLSGTRWCARVTA